MFTSWSAKLWPYQHWYQSGVSNWCTSGLNHFIIGQTIIKPRAAKVEFKICLRSAGFQLNYFPKKKKNSSCKLLTVSSVNRPWLQKIFQSPTVFCKWDNEFVCISGESTVFRQRTSEKFSMWTEKTFNTFTALFSVSTFAVDTSQLRQFKGSHALPWSCKHFGDLISALLRAVKHVKEAVMAS